MPRRSTYYYRIGLGKCVECPNEVDEFVRCRPCLDARNEQKRQARARMRPIGPDTRHVIKIRYGK